MRHYRRALFLLTVGVAGAAGLARDGLGVAAQSSSGAPAADGRFVEVTADAGIQIPFAFGSPDRPWVTDSGGAGAGWLDFDLDGRLDLVLLSGLPGPSDRPAAATAAALAGQPLPESLLPDGTLPRYRLLRGAGRGAFEAAPPEAGLHDASWASAVAVADVDDDGYPDVYVTSIGPNRLYRNNGDGSFTPWEAGLEHPGWGTGAAFTDLDLDGDLDLYLANYVDFDPTRAPDPVENACVYLGIRVFCGPRGLAGERDVLYRNNGDGTFEPWPGIEVDPEAGYGFAALPTDCDGDGRQEIYVANDSNINLLYRLDGEGVEDLSLFSGAGYSGGGLEQAGMGIAAGDVDGNGTLDLLVTNFQHDYNTLYRNDGACSFVDVSPESGLASATYPYMSWAPLLADFDGDADLDLFVATGHLYPQLEEVGLEPFAQRDLLLLGRRRETGGVLFEDAGAAAGPGIDTPASSRAAAYGDYDDDGDLDLVVTRIDAPPVLLRNDGGSAYPALRVTLVGTLANRSAYGARLRVRSGDVVQWVEHRHGDGYLGTNDPRILVHLPSGRADEVEVLWPGGGSTLLGPLEPGTVVVRQGPGLVGRRP